MQSRYAREVELSGVRRAARCALLGTYVSLTLAFAIPSAHAQSDDERARTHFEAGSSYYDQAQYDAAAREFQRAYDLSARPELLLNISQAQERALQFDQAILAAQQYLTVVPAAPDRLTIEDRIKNLEQLKQRFEQGGPAPNDPPGALPVQADPNALPQAGDVDRPVLGATTDQPPTAAGTTAGTLEAPPPTAPAPTPAPEYKSPLMLPAIVLMGVGGASLVASLVTGLVAHGDYNTLERECDTGGACPTTVRDELDRGDTLATTSTVLAVIGVLAAGTGGALLYVGTRQEAEHARSHTGIHAGNIEAKTKASGRRASQTFAMGPGLTPLSLQGTLKF